MNTIALPQDPIPVRRVNVYVTREIAFDIEKMLKVTRGVLGRLGCGGCHSGRLIDFHVVEDFVVNAKSLELHELPRGEHF